MLSLKQLGIILALAASCFAQSPQLYLPFAGYSGAIGNSFTNTDISNGGQNCTGAGSYQAGAAGYVYAPKPAAIKFPAPTMVCGTLVTGVSSFAMKWVTGGSPVQFSNFHPTGTVGRFGQYFCANFNNEALGVGQESNSAFEGTGEANAYLSLNGMGLEAEPTNNPILFYNYPGGSCETDPTAWVWQSVAYNTSSTSFQGLQMTIWVYTITVSGSTPVFHLAFTQSRTSTLAANATYNTFGIGISGGEAEVPPGDCSPSCAVYWGPSLGDFTSANGPLLPAGVLPSDGVVDEARVVDWRSAGVSGWGGNGTIPSSAWSQCGSTVTAGTSAASVQALLNACSANTYLLLASGTFNWTSAVTVPANRVLRGSGPNSTLIVFGSGATQCFGNRGLICLGSNPGNYPSPSSWYEWTQGFPAYNNTLILSNGTGCTLGSTCTITPNSTLLVLDQDDDGYTGDTPSGTSVDNGNFYNCSDQYTSTPSGCSDSGGNAGNGNPHRYQEEFVTAASINTSNGALVLNRPLHYPNWRLSQTPHVVPVTVNQNSGVESLSIDTSALNSSTYFSSVLIKGCVNCWDYQVRKVNQPQFGTWIVLSSHVQVDQGYCYGALLNPGAHCVELAMVSDSLIQNNICHQCTNSFHIEASSEGNVFGYNLSIGDAFANTNLSETFRTHSNGVGMNLWEGNMGPSFRPDDTHGTGPLQTAYRNFFNGWKICPTGTNNCGNATPTSFEANAILPNAYSRYDNLVGNILGEPGFHTTYKANSLTTNAVLSLGWGNGAASPPVPNDSLGTCAASKTVLCWANYDVVTAAVRFCGASSDTGWSTTCSSTSEIPTSAPAYQNLAPWLGDAGAGQSALPGSFYLSAKPAWFQSIAYPAIGPDVSSGNVGICSGTLNTAGQKVGLPATLNAQCTGTSLTTGWTGSVNAIPAFSCYLADGGVIDGTGSALTFQPNACYNGGSSPTASTPTFQFAAGTYYAPFLDAIACTTGPVACYNTTGSPATNGTTGCTTGTLYTTPVLIPKSETLYAVCGGTGYTDSSVGSAAYVLQPRASAQAMIAEVK